MGDETEALVMTPIAAIVQRGDEIYTEDASGNCELRAQCRDIPDAAWLGWSLAQAHNVPHKVEPATEAPQDEGISALVQFAGPVEDERLVMVFGILSGNIPMPEITPELRRRAVEEIMQGQT
jgi:hypothetical protein